MSDSPAKPETTRSPLWPWAALVAAMIWVAVARVPLILNAEVHLDSDLAVDGLTLLDAMKGHWRWHFPGTPYMGTPPVALAMPGAYLLGANAMSLVIGGVVAYEAVVLACFILNWRVFGPRVAAWGLVPLAFASVGTVWLSGRLTGGHLMTVAWHATALTLLHALMRKGGLFRAVILGVWCGFGFYLDQMFLMTLLVVVAIAFPAMLGAQGWLRKSGLILACVAGFAVGVQPRFLGERADPYDAYKEQFSTILRPETAGPLAGHIDREKVRKLLLEHGRLFGQECLPRLISGHLLTGLDVPTKPKPSIVGAEAKGQPRKEIFPGLGLATTLASLALLLFAIAALILGRKEEPPSASAVRLAALMSGVLVSAGFLISSNIFNSDNYRYLVYWLVAWSIGFGLLMDGFWRRGWAGRLLAPILGLALAALFTLDTADWYRGFGWLDDRFRPVKRALNDPALTWLRDHRGDRDAIFGGYWDVYRLQFLLGGKIEGLPFPNYPDRFNAAGRFLGRRPQLLIARRGELGGFYQDKALDDGGTVLMRAPNLLIIDWPVKP